MFTPHWVIISTESIYKGDTLPLEGDRSRGKLMGNYVHPLVDDDVVYTTTFLLLCGQRAYQIPPIGHKRGLGLLLRLQPIGYLLSQ